MEIENLARYKTAYSPLFKTFVEIKKVRLDESGSVIIFDTLMEGREMMFCLDELDDFCL